MIPATLGPLDCWTNGLRGPAVLVALHGLGQRPETSRGGYLSFSDMSQLPATCELAGLPLVLPAAPRRNWTRRHIPDIRETIEAAMDAAGADTCWLAGFSDGATWAYRVAMADPNVSAAVIHSMLWSGPPLNEPPRDIPLLFVRSLEDPTPTGDQTLACYECHLSLGRHPERIDQMGRHPADGRLAGHWWSPETSQRAIDWLARLPGSEKPA